MKEKDYQYNTTVERTNLRTYLASLLIATIGIALIASTHFVTYVRNIPALQSVLSELGALCIVSVAIALTWEPD